MDFSGLTVRMLVLIVALGMAFPIFVPDSVLAAKAPAKRKPSVAKSSAAMAAAQQYAEAIASGDQLAFGRLDFACLYGMVATGMAPTKMFPAESARIYAACWERLAKVHETAIQQDDLGVQALWPGKGALVFFREDLAEYAPSFFVMDRLRLSPSGGGLKIEALDSVPVTAASFRVRAGSPLVQVPAVAVKVSVTYQDPLTAPIAFAPSEDLLTRKMKKDRWALKGITVKFVVLTGLKKLGFPGDETVLNIPIKGPNGASIPFVLERGGFLHDTRVWWGPLDAPDTLSDAIARVSQYPEQRDRVTLLNRILLINPNKRDALTLLADEMYQTLLSLGGSAHGSPLGDAVLAVRYNELYWNGVAQTYRMEIAEPSFMAQRGPLMPADFLYRMLSVRETLARLSPEDTDNRLKLGIGYRWNREHENAIAVHEQLVKDTPQERAAARTRALLELAWSRIAKVEWSRRLEDPDILAAYRDAEEAARLAQTPLDKFTAYYAMTYSLPFTPNRDSKQMLQLLTEARKWYLQVPGATTASWLYLLQNDTLNGIVHSDPAFKPLLAGT